MKKIWIVLLVILGLAGLSVWWDFLFHPGTYFLLDAVNVPVSSIRGGFFQNTLYRFINDFFSLILGYIRYSKLWYFLILFFSGVLGYLLVWCMGRLLCISAPYERVTALAGVLFMMINPFLYERMTTQPGIYLAVVLLWYGLYFLIKNISGSNVKNYLLSGLFFGFAVTLSPHTIFMIGLILVAYMAFFVREKKGFLSIGYLMGIVILLNLNRLIGSIIWGNSTVMSAVSTFSQANIDNFLSNGLRPLGVEFTNLLLYGFWGERYRHMALPQSRGWAIYGFVILGIVGLGWYKIFQKQKKLAFFLLVLVMVAWVCGVGNASHLRGQYTEWLYEYVPYYIGLREPQKWIGLVMLVYALGFGVGIGYLFTALTKALPFTKHWAGELVFLGIVLGLLHGRAPNVLGGFHGQLTMTDYPDELGVYRQYYIQQEKTYLVLPWHSYMACDWTHGKIIGNLMDQYFLPWNAIIADNLEIGTLYSNSSSQRSKDIELFLKTKDPRPLQKYGIQTILFLDKCADFPVYQFLDSSPFLQRSYVTTHLKAYDISYEK